MEIKKNECYEISIVDMAEDGQGIGKIGDFVVFVKDTVIGDVAKVKLVKVLKHYGFGRLEELLVPSKDRVEPLCAHAKACGGCTLQHLSYEKQLEYKFDQVKNCLIRIGGFFEIEKIMEGPYGMEKPFRYRNKAQFPTGMGKDFKPVIGFYAGRTHSIIDTRECFLQSEISDEIIEIIREFMEEFHISTYDETGKKGLLRHILTRVGFTTGEIMVCLVINGKKVPNVEELIQRLTKIEGMTSICLNINKEHTNKILGDTCVTLWGRGYIEDYIGEVKYQISPLSFYQVNPVQTKVLYEKALEYAGLTGEETVWDLYCGIGTISLFLAQKAKWVYGVEIVPQAIEDARRNAKINGMENVTFFVGKAEEVLPKEYEENKVYAKVIVVDPPRKGCDETLLKTIHEMQPERVVYVSCNPATLARDLKVLAGYGYEVKKVAVVDQFCQTTHVETVVLLSTQKAKRYVDIEITTDELDLTCAEAKATYEQIKTYIKGKYGFNVSNLYIAQVKKEFDIIERVNYNKGTEGHKVPQVTEKKRDAIIDALKHFKVI